MRRRKIRVFIKKSQVEPNIFPAATKKNEFTDLMRSWKSLHFNCFHLRIAQQFYCTHKNFLFQSMRMRCIWMKRCVRLARKFSHIFMSWYEWITCLNGMWLSVSVMIERMSKIILSANCQVKLSQSFHSTKFNDQHLTEGGTHWFEKINATLSLRVALLNFHHYF